MDDKIQLDIIRSISATLDNAVYQIISFAYDLMIKLANINIFGNANDFAIRVYTLIGIFMVFRLSFSMINYIINPESITDKEKGASNLIKRIIITFALIILSPQLFNLMSEAQNAILKDNILPKFILGSSYDGNSNNQLKIDPTFCDDLATTEKDGDYISLLVYRPFFQINSIYKENQEVRNYLKNGYCNAKNVPALLRSSIYNAPNMASNNQINNGTSGVYYVDYWFIISALVGGAVALILIGFCMDVAVRSIKIGFLELIAPVPIISYMEPSQGKNGMLKKWGTELAKTWADIFIRLAGLYLAIYIIQGIQSNNDSSLWITLFILIGTLIFAKKLPDLIGSIFGIKLSGSFQFNPIKKFQDQALNGKSITGFIGKSSTALAGAGLSGVGAVVGYNRSKAKFSNENNKIDKEMAKKISQIQSKRDIALNNAKNDYERRLINKNFGKELYDIKQETNQKRDKLNNDYDKFSFKHPIAAGAKEVVKGGQLGYQKGAKNLSEVLKNATSASKMAAEIRNNNDIFNFKARVEDFITDISGAKNDSGTSSEIKKEIKATSEQLKDIENAINSINTSIAYVNQTIPGAITFDTSAGKARVNENYNFTNANMTKDQIKQFLDDLQTLRKSQQEKNKYMNTLNDSLKLKEGKK